MAVSLVSTGVQFPDSSIQTSAGISSGSVITDFTTSGTYTKGAGVTFVIFQCLGGGGGGATNVVSYNTKGGGGGGGGGMVERKFAASMLPATLTVTVGAGGDAGSTGFTSNGAGGGLTRIIDSNSIVYCQAGGGGRGIADGQAPMGGGVISANAQVSTSYNGFGSAAVTTATWNPPDGIAFGTSAGIQPQAGGSYGEYGGGSGASGGFAASNGQQGGSSLHGGGGGGGGAGAEGGGSAGNPGQGGRSGIYPNVFTAKTGELAGGGTSASTPTYAFAGNGGQGGAYQSSGGQGGRGGGGGGGGGGAAAGSGGSGFVRIIELR